MGYWSKKAELVKGIFMQFQVDLRSAIDKGSFRVIKQNIEVSN